MRNKIDLAGQRFNRLVVVEEAGRDKFGSVLWRCRCDCGSEVTVHSRSLRTGATQSCGCYNRERVSERSTKHGMCHTRLYSIWRNILTRTGVNKCRDEADKRRYQDRGISLCEGWKTFENFRDWGLSHGYEDSLQIDRIDNDLGYMPENCRWVTPKENTNNRRNTLRLPDGTSLAMFCAEVGIYTRENGKMSRQYNRVCMMYLKHHKIHPELLAKANEYLNTLRKLKACIDLLKDVKEFKEKCNDLQMISLPKT